MRCHFEFQSTDNDTGIHGLFGGVEWAELCITDPTGVDFVVARAQGNLQNFGLSDVFFESRELLVGYEVIVTNEDEDDADPNGMSQPIASIHVPPTVTQLTIPTEFLEASTAYELELIAIEESGNQTMTVFFFDTP